MVRENTEYPCPSQNNPSGSVREPQVGETLFISKYYLIVSGFRYAHYCDYACIAAHINGLCPKRNLRTVYSHLEVKLGQHCMKCTLIKTLPFPKKM